MTNSLEREGSYILYQLTRTLTPEPISCHTCRKKEDKIDIQQCLKKDLSPQTYLKLALILSNNGSNVDLDNSREDVVLLGNFATLIAEDSTFALLLIERLYLLCSEHEGLDTIQIISQLLGKSDEFHKYRELEFIKLLRQEMKPSTIQQIKQQVEAKAVQLDRLVVSDIKLARLIPLLGAVYGSPNSLYDMSFFRQDSLTIISDVVNQQPELAERAQSYEEDSQSSQTNICDYLPDVDDNEHLILSLPLDSSTSDIE
ncbi:hypothetical protein A0J61_02210 [Choanephora cucurbitarum]|uniref:Uncharacterized protein n=1 Tax=Choanephora cucurbitarum TaxID=101091 RepID=A0A1C7NR63_9FUNG|nr:hypothetical protein A0J61_02210 [Choanephora cucurbitarum]